jgi:hypothetical protein
MGGRLPLTMHGARVGSWGIPQNPRSRLQGTRPDESTPDHSLRLGWTPPQTAPTDVPVGAGTCPAPCRNLLCRQSVSCGRERVRGLAEIAAPRMNLSAGYRD